MRILTGPGTKLGFEPLTPIDVGIPRFVQWYFDYHRLPRRIKGVGGAAVSGRLAVAGTEARPTG